MPTSGYLQALVELAARDSIDALLDQAVALLERELGMRTRIEIWDDAGVYVRGDAATVDVEWIGFSHTIGAIYLERAPDERCTVELMSMQLAPLVERLVDREASRRLSIREDIERLYDRRILDALARSDGNASAVARELRVSRNRVAKVMRRWSKNERVGVRNDWKNERNVM